MSDLALVYEYLRAKLRIDIHDDRGMTTTEVAIITFLLAAAAIVVLGVIYTAAKGNAERIPMPSAPAS